MYLGVLHISRKLFLYLLLLGILVALFFLTHTFAHATTGINQQINFEGRLLTASGATVPDGYYNIQFKIYQDGDGLSTGNTTGSPTGALDWTESYLNANIQGVQVINGFMSVQLGSITPFGSNVNWNQSNLWLSMNIAGINVSCTPFTSCSPDGEMLPMKRLSSSPYALNSAQLGGLTNAQFLQIAQGVQTDASTSTNTIYLNKTGAGGNFIDFQSAAADVFTVGSAGDLTLGSNANHTFTVTTSAASTAGKSLAVAGGAGGTGTGSSGGTLVLQGGAAGGTNAAGGNITIDAGTGTGSGVAGAINIGTNAASNIQIGSTTLATGSQTIGIGNNNTAGSTTNVTLGTGGLATGGTTAIQSKGNTTLATNGTTRATLDTTGKLYLGDGTTSTSTGTFTVLGSTGAAANAGYSLSLQGGVSGTGAVNGGDVTIQGGATGGTGVQGLVKLSTSSFTSAVNQSFAVSSTVTQANIDNNSAIDISSSVAGPVTVTIPAPTTKVSGRLLYALVTGSNPVILSPSGGSAVTMSPNTAVTLVWNTNANGWLNAGADSGDSGYIQNQTATTQTAGFKINGVGTAASFVGSSLDVASAGTLNLGTGVATTISVGSTSTAVAQTFNLGYNSTAGSTSSVNIGNLLSTSGTLIQGGTGANAVSIQSGIGGTISVGTTNTANTVQIGSTTLTGTQAIGIGNNATASGITNIIIGSTNTTSATTIRSGTGGITLTGPVTTSSTINTATISGGTLASTGLTFGSAASTVGLTSAGVGVAGGGLTVQGGQSGTGAVNGGDVSVQGGTSAGTGVQGLVKLSTTAFTTAANQSFGVNGAVTQANIDNYSAIQLSSTVAGPITVTASAPTNSTVGRVLYVTVTGSNPIILSPTGGTAVTLTPKTTATLIWNATGTAWTNAGVDSGSGNYIQNQTASPQAAGFNISGVGTAANFVGSSLDVASAGTLSIGTGVSTGVIIGHTTTASTITIGGTGANTIALGNTQTAGTISIGGALTGGSVSIGGTAGGTSAVTIQGGTSSTAVSIQSGTGGTISIGTNNIVNTVQIGSTTLSTGTQTVNVGTGAAGGTTNVNIGSNNSAGGGTTAIQSKANTTITTGGVTRATFDTSGNLYVGNGPNSVSPANFTIQGTTSSVTAVTGGTVTVQGGNATTGTANGGNLVLSGGSASGSGSNGLVILTTTSAQTVNDSNCYNVLASCTISLTSLNNNSAIIAGFPTTAGQTVTLPNPPNTTAGRQVYVTASNGSQDFTLIANSGAGAGIEQDIAMRQNTSATMVWNGADWTAAGASSSTTLQSAYNNTLQSAGGAELVVSKTSSTNGLTIRDSTTASVNGTLLQVQSKTAANLFSVSSNVSDYASDNGAETAGGSSTTFPSNTWSTSGTGVTLLRYTTAGNYIATGQASTSVQTSATANTGVKNQIVDPTSGSNVGLTANTQYNVSFSTRLLSGTFTTLTVYYSVNGTTQSVPCVNSQTSQTSITSNWSKINCSFTAPTSGETTSNAILIQQSDATARTFYVDNLSVTIAAGQNYATDGGVDDSVNFSTNWTSAGAGTVSVTQNPSDGNDTSDSAQAAISTNTAAAGIRNKLSIYPLANTLYRISVYAKLNAGAAFNDFKVRYSPDGGTNYVDCVDYNTQTVVTTAWTPITCYINTIGTAVSNPYAYFIQTNAPGGTRNFSVDTFSMTLANSTTPDVQIGSGTAGGPVTLFTLDSAASAPIAANNSSLYGSMYYDTTQGKIQCYQAAGWGACGASPDNIVTISPEYTNAVMHGTGVGTMVSDFCSGAGGVNINDGTSGQPSICGSSETYNFYRWTSPQPTPQAYSIYVTYQLPSTFKQFTSGQTSLQARVDNTSNAFVKMQIYKNHSGLTTCGGNITITTIASTWQYPAASGTADPSTCGFTGSDSIVFKITTSANSNANAFVGNLNFTFSNS
jgi:hypothetical protein